MNNKNNIRNISVIAHVDHGKSTLTDSLVAAAGIISVENAGNQRIMDTRADEQERCITIKSTGISLYFDADSLENNILEDYSVKAEFLINLIDSPGHVDFSSEVTAALRITDGALVVVDCIEEVCVQTETVLRQALTERIIPILTINKLDRCFLELRYDGETAYSSFLRVIENINIIISTYRDNSLGELYLYPDKGNISFSAGIHGWAFSIHTFSILYSINHGFDEKKIKQKLWGNHFFDNKSKKWLKKKSNNLCVRGFVKYCYDPLKVLIQKCVEEKYKEVEILCEKLKLSEIYDKISTKFKGKVLMKKILQQWIPAHKSMIGMIIKHLPSPEIAQKYRTEIIYEGPVDDIFSKSMKLCDPKGPLMLYISKMIPNFDRTRFLAFGRVFSGRVFSGQKVRIMGSNFIKGQTKDLFTKTVQRTIVCMGRKLEAVEGVSCGNTVALVGLDQYISKNATITNDNFIDAFPIKAMKFSVHPVVRRAVNVKFPSDLPKLLEGLRKLSRSDPMVQCITEDSGEHVIAGAGELHLEICLKDLREDFLPGVEIITSDPVVPYRETIINQSIRTAMSKSPNKHNRLYAQAFPMGDKLAQFIDERIIEPSDNSKERSKVLVDEFKWDKDSSKRIWSFGPSYIGPNILVDDTKSVQYLDEIKDSCVSAFQWATKEGILCSEFMRGVIFYIKDITLHTDAIHRGGGQIIPPFRRVLYASFLLGSPRLMEPMFLVDIVAFSNILGGVYSTLASKRGKIFEETNKTGTPLYNIKAYMPVSESFGFSADLRAATSGQAFPQCIFDHWALIHSDPLLDGNNTNKIVNNIRKRKGLKFELPKVEEYEDKI